MCSKRLYTKVKAKSCVDSPKGILVNTNSFDFVTIQIKFKVIIFKLISLDR